MEATQYLTHSNKEIREFARKWNNKQISQIKLIDIIKTQGSPSFVRFRFNYHRKRKQIIRINLDLYMDYDPAGYPSKNIQIRFADYDQIQWSTYPSIFHINLYNIENEIKLLGRIENAFVSRLFNPPRYLKATNVYDLLRKIKRLSNYHFSLWGRFITWLTP